VRGRPVLMPTGDVNGAAKYGPPIAMSGGGDANLEAPAIRPSGTASQVQ